MRYWTPEDIFDVLCPYCDTEIEFWKDEPARLCRNCGMQVRNPRTDLGCAKWCKFAEECLGKNVDEVVAAAPMIETLRAKVHLRFGAGSAAVVSGEEVHGIADTLAVAEGGDPRIIKCAALLVGAVEGLALASGAETLATVLTEAAFEEGITHRIVETVRGVREGREPTTIEARVISDALRVARALRAGHPEMPERLCTQSAKLLASHRLGLSGG